MKSAHPQPAIQIYIYNYQYSGVITFLNPRSNQLLETITCFFDMVTFQIVKSACLHTPPFSTLFIYSRSNFINLFPQPTDLKLACIHSRLRRYEHVEQGCQNHSIMWATGPFSFKK